MITCVEKGMSILSSQEQEKVNFAINKLKVWDYRYEVGSISAAFYEAWEFRIITHLHESMIEN